MRYGLSPARVTQVVKLLHLPHKMQQYVIALPPREQRLYSGRRLREIGRLSNEVARLGALDELRETAQESQFPQQG